MDSCHLFNFLFGTKKATTELRRCFSNSMNGSPSTSAAAAAAAADDDENSQQPPRAPPPSPLKQLQMKFVAFANKTTNRQQTPPPTPKKSQLVVESREGRDFLSCQTKVQVSTKAEGISEQPAPVKTQGGTYRATLVESVDIDEYSDDAVFDKNPTEDEPKFLKVEAKLGRGTDNVTTTTTTTIASQQELEAEGAAELEPKRVSPFGELISREERENVQPEQEEVITLIQTNSAARQPRQLVLYDDECNRNEEQVVSPSAQVYKFVTEIQQTHNHSPSRAHLSRIGQWRSSDDCGYLQHLVSCSDDNSNNQLEQRNHEVDQMLRDKRRVRNIVQSFETSSRTSIETIDATVSSPRRSHKSPAGGRILSRGMTIDSSTPTKQHFAGQLGGRNVNKLQITTIDINNNIENNSFTYNHSSSISSQVKPTTIVKPLPPKTPPKSLKAKYLTWQLTQLSGKAQKIDQLFKDEKFLVKLFDNLEPIDRCAAAQVCRKWRDVLYSKRAYWKDLVSVIDCTQLRRDQLVECIVSTLQSAKLKQQQKLQQHQTGGQVNGGHQPSLKLSKTTNNSTTTLSTTESSLTSGVVTLTSSEKLAQDLEQLDQDDVWRIQELCNRYTHRNNQVAYSVTRVSQYQIPNCPPTQQQHQQQQPMDSQQQTIEPMCQASKSSSIPSQISSTFSSVSLSSLLSPLSESNRIEFLREKLYTSLDERGFDAICLFGATDEDIEDLIGKVPSGAHRRISVARLNNCCITDRGLDLFVSTFSQLEELELSGCNEISNAIELDQLNRLRSLIITDCINIADGIAQRLAQIIDQLEHLTIQAYHLTDAFIDYLSLNADTSNLKRLGLPDCKEITNQSLVIIAKHLPHLEALSLSGSTKICDDGIEILAEQANRLQSLDLSWCTKITDASLECIACDLGNTLTDLILDRNVNITDAGLVFLATKPNRLTLLHIRWCPRISDIGLESVLQIKTLRYLSVAGLQQITARSLMCLVETNLLEVELTNCQAVNNELQSFLSTRMPRCRVIF